MRGEWVRLCNDAEVMGEREVMHGGPEREGGGGGGVRAD